MTLSDWAIYLGVKAVNWLNPLLGIAGLGVSVWAFWLSRKLGYLLVAICFLLTLGGQFVLPAINRAIATRWPAQPEIAPEIEQQYMQELVSLNEKYYPTGRTGTLTLKLPLDQIVLVFGLWLLAKHESKRIAKQ